MIRLFEVDENYRLQLNKEWILMIPEFKELLQRDRGSVGDYEGRKKLKAIRELSYIYLMEDFLSPFREEEEYNRHISALKECGMTEKDIDDAILAARVKYAALLESNAPMLRTLKLVKASRERLEDYFNSIDLTRVNAKGDLIYNVSTYMNSVKQLKPMEDSINEYEEAVYAQLRNDKGIRGNASKGFNEGRKRELSESPGKENSNEYTGPKFTSIPVVTKTDRE